MTQVVRTPRLTRTPSIRTLDTHPNARLPFMPRWLLLAGLLALFLPSTRLAAQAEPGRVTGTVTAIEGGTPIAGVHVTVLGTPLTAETNEQGRYTIALAPGMYRLRASSIGFTPVAMDSVPVAAGKPTTADFQMKRQTVTLEQVVVVGYGSQAKRDVTGSVASVTAEQIQQIPTTNALDAIKGRVAGVDITSGGYKPGDGVTVRIRGARSIKASNDPLYVLDGIPIAGGIGDLNPSDIASIEVLKDASATAIYGSRGANGVVLVTTRRGTAGRTRITYDTYAASQRAAKKVSVFDGPAFAEYKREAYRAAGVYKCPAGVAQCAAGDADAFYSQELAALNAGISTDWQDIIVRPGSQLNNQLSVAGGNDRTQYAVSGNLMRQI
ncbi:MAG TPA: TonB-dependent receptor plug domain-containing protein, partial [Gemmatimonadaceae bacterium]|nr:TonB-dependent receptor plug domain-containing protein [Gemmatimonadaceae bacterium]